MVAGSRARINVMISYEAWKRLRAAAEGPRRKFTSIAEVIERLAIDHLPPFPENGDDEDNEL